MIRAKKLNMSQIFTAEGRVVPVTIVEVLDGNLDSLAEETNVVVVGKSKGKGFAGVMKRWGFSGSQATRGQSDKPRAAGSIGAQTPSKVFKGKKMAGKTGNKKVTVKGLKVVNVDTSSRRLMLSGPVPGSRNSELVIKLLD